jgi:enterochelin esterase family protein
MDLSEADLILFVRVETSFGLAGFVEAALGDYATRSVGDLLTRLEAHTADFDKGAFDFIVEEAEGEHGFWSEVARSAVFLSIWASFEFAVTEYVESHLGESPDSRLKVKDLRGGVLEATKTLVIQAAAHQPSCLTAQTGPETPPNPDIESPRLGKAWTLFKAGDRTAFSNLLDSLRGEGPLVEGLPEVGDEVLVTFLWEADSDTWKVDLYGGLPAPGYDRNKPMYQIPDTRIWYRTERMPTDSRFQYAFHLNDPGIGLASEDERISHGRAHPRRFDPLNPNRVWADSYLELPDAPEQPYLRRRDGVARGGLRLDSLWSQELAEYRRIGIYEPPSLDASAGPYPLLIVFDGEWFGTQQNAPMPLPTTLDNLVADGKVPEFVAVLVENQGTRNRALTNTPAFAGFVARELIPWVQERYPVSSDPARVVTAGFSNGGLAAAYVGLEHPESVGNVVALSGWWAHQNRNYETNYFVTPDYRLDLGWIIREFAARPRLPLRFYLTVGRFDVYWVNTVRMNRHMRDVLTAKGYPLVYEEFHGGHDVIAIRGKVADGLIAITSGWTN